MATEDQRLLEASLLGRLELVKQLLDSGKGIDPNITDVNGRTSLYLATTYGHLEIVKVLLEHGADPNIADKYNQTPLYWASYQGLLEIVKELLLYDADPNIINRNNETPLSIASANGRLEVVKELLSAGADPNISVDRHNKKPLHRAFQGGRLEIIKELLLYGADPNIANIDDVNILYWASMDKYSEAVNLLKNHFASLYLLSLKTIRKYKIDVASLPPLILSN